MIIEPGFSKSAIRPVTKNVTTSKNGSNFTEAFRNMPVITKKKVSLIHSLFKRGRERELLIKYLQVNS